MAHGVVGQAADEGCRELILLGQTVNSYKDRDANGRLWRLSDLLEELHQIEGIVDEAVDPAFAQDGL